MEKTIKWLEKNGYKVLGFNNTMDGKDIMYVDVWDTNRDTQKVIKYLTRYQKNTSYRYVDDWETLQIIFK